MWSSDSDREKAVSLTTATSSSSCPSSPFDPPPTPPHPRRRRQRARRHALRRAVRNNSSADAAAEDEEPAVEAEAEDVWRGLQRRAQSAWPRRASRPVVVAGEEESLARSGSADSGGVGRARSLTDDDLEELKGCVDLGFGFSYNEIPELCGTLPALELCYSMSKRFLDDHQQKQQQSKAEEAAPASPAQPVATNWKISSPGDSPDEVKARPRGCMHRQAMQLSTTIVDYASLGDDEQGDSILLASAFVEMKSKELCVCGLIDNEVETVLLIKTHGNFAEFIITLIARSIQAHHITGSCPQFCGTMCKDESKLGEEVVKQHQ